MKDHNSYKFIIRTKLKKKTRRLNILGSFLIIIFSFWLYMKWEVISLKSLPNELNPIVNEILSNKEYIQSGSYMKLLESSFNEEIGNLIKENKLCSIVHYQSNGVAFNFKCEDDSSNHFYDTDEEYYLVKITNELNEESFLTYEQFVDYCDNRVKLEDNWYFFEKHIYFD